MEAAMIESEQTTDDKGNLLPEYMKEVTLESPAKEGTNWFVDEAVVTPSDSGKVIKKSMQLNYMNAIYGSIRTVWKNGWAKPATAETATACGPGSVTTGWAGIPFTKLTTP